MIFYKNIKKHKKSNEKNLIFSIFDAGVVSDLDDQLKNANECKSFYNLSYVNGALKTGLGFQDLAIPASIDNLQDCHTANFAEDIDVIKGIWLDRWFQPDSNSYFYNLMLIDTKFKIWSLPLIDEFEGMVWPQSTALKSFPIYQCLYRISGKDACLFFSKEGMLAITSVTASLYENIPPIISCAVHYDKFFGITNTNRNMLIYKSNTNLLEWEDEENNTIEFLDNVGSFNKVIAFNDYVYLFREYGITKISIYSSTKDFSFTHLYNSASRIYENSVCLCGENIFFMTRDGLYAFNGNSVNKIASDYDVYFKNLDNKFASSACLNGKYYYATKCNFNDDNVVGCENQSYVNNVLFEIDINNFKLNLLRGVDILKILAIDIPYFSKLCACFNTDNFKQRVGELVYNGSIFENVTDKCWTSFFTDLGYKSKRKKIKEIIIISKFNCEIEIKSDEETKVYKFTGNPNEQRISVCIYGKNFQFSFKTNENQCDIQKPMIVFDVLQ